MAELRRILHVEDDPSIQAVAKVALEAIGGYDVLSCSSGAEALEAVEQFVPQFILLDVMMPGMGGPETLAKLHERIDLQDIPVAFMTAKVQPGEIELLRGLGAREVIIKPFDPMRLAGQIRNIWEANRRYRPPAPFARTARPIRRWSHRRQRPSHPPRASCRAWPRCCATKSSTPPTKPPSMTSRSWRHASAAPPSR